MNIPEVEEEMGIKITDTLVAVVIDEHGVWRAMTEHNTQGSYYDCCQEVDPWEVKVQYVEDIASGEIVWMSKGKNE